MAVVITSPKGPTPSDNRIIFKLLGNLGADQEVTPEGNNAVGLILENVSGDLTDGVWRVVEPLEDSELSFIRLPNIGTELIIALFNSIGATVPDDLPDDLDRYKPNDLTLTFVGGATATLEGEFVSMDNTDYVWDISIECDNPQDWTAWSGDGGQYAEIVEDFPLNKLVFINGMAEQMTEALLSTWIDETVTGYTNDGTVITFSNVGYEFIALTSPSLFPLFSITTNIRQIYSRCSGAHTFSNMTNLEKVYLLNTDFDDHDGLKLFNNNPALHTVYWSGWGATASYDLFGTDSLGALTKIFMPNASAVDDSETGWLGSVNFATLSLWIRSGAESDQEVIDAIAGGATVKYNDSLIYPDGLNSPFPVNSYWEVNPANSTIEGKTGSPLEGIELEIEAGESNTPGLQIEESGSSLWSDGTTGNGIGMNFTITGATAGSIFVGLNSYSYEVDVIINGTPHSTHRLFFTPGEEVRFDASQITRSVIGRPKVTTLGVDSSQAYGTVQLRIRIRTSSGVLEEEYLSDKVVFWKARLKDVDFYNWTPSDYLPGPSGDSLFLTDYPRNEDRLVLRGGNYYMGLFYPGTPEGIEDTLRVRRRQYASEGGSLMSTGFATPTAVVNDGLPDIWKVAVINLGGSQWGTLAGTGYYSIDLYDTEAEAKQTESIGLTVWDGECNQGATVHFLNKLGGMESYYFTQRKLEEGRVNQFKAEIHTGEYAPQDNGEYAYLLQAVDRVTLRSNWLTEAVQNWLVEELTESPFILIEVEGVQVRAYCRESSWTKRTIINDAIFDVNVEFEISERRYSPLV